MIDLGMRLSRNFTLGEMVRSQAAARRGLPNVPTAAQIENLRLLCEHVLQPVRDHFGKPVAISSGFRSPAVNRAAGSKAKHSQHMDGRAADFEVFGVSNFEVAAFIRDNLPFDQLILEFYTPGVPNSGWVHVSYRHDARRGQALTTSDGRVYRSGLIA